MTNITTEISYSPPCSAATIGHTSAMRARQMRLGRCRTVALPTTARRPSSRPILVDELTAAGSTGTREPTGVAQRPVDCLGSTAHEHAERGRTTVHFREAHATSTRD